MKSELLWRLCRRHEWNKGFISAQALTDLALDDSEQGEGLNVVEELRSEPYITYQKNKGYRIKNNPDSQAEAAYRLQQVTVRTDLQIKSTLSRFEQAGAWSAYDKEEVLARLPEW